MTTQAEQIAALNDRFRRQLMMPLFFETCIVPGQVMTTFGINSMTGIEKLEIFFKVREFNDFTVDNDPHEEHDFGAFEYHGKKIFWKIDYYAPDLMHGSEDPTDLTKTVRVLTIMLANEY